MSGSPAYLRSRAAMPNYLLGVCVAIWLISRLSWIGRLNTKSKPSRLLRCGEVLYLLKREPAAFASKRIQCGARQQNEVKEKKKGKCCGMR